MFLAALSAVLVASACTSGSAGSRAVGPSANPSPPASPPLTTRASSSASGPPRFARVAVIVMENHGFDQVIGNPDAPFINGLAKEGALASSYRAVAHPSLPNYLAITGGSTFGIASDCTTCVVRGPSIVDQLEAAGISWRAYLEGLPGPCATQGASGAYAKKHDPFPYYASILAHPVWCANVVPLSTLAEDERAGLPRAIWISPDTCHDMHSCPVATGDAFLRGLVPGLLRAMGPDGVLFLTWDESEDVSNRVALIAAGPLARSGVRSAQPFTHYSLLRTIEEGLGLPPLRNAATARPLNALLTAG